VMNMNEETEAKELARKLHEVLDTAPGLIAVDALIERLKGRTTIAKHIAEEVEIKLSTKSKD
jgi:hypothetical protein